MSAEKLQHDKYFFSWSPCHFLSGCSEPLGMKSGHIQDYQITASSIFRTLNMDMFTWEPRKARLDKQGKVNAWTFGHNDQSQWLQVTFLRLFHHRQSIALQDFLLVRWMLKSLHSHNFKCTFDFSLPKLIKQKFLIKPCPWTIFTLVFIYGYYYQVDTADCARSENFCINFHLFECFVLRLILKVWW